MAGSGYLCLGLKGTFLQIKSLMRLHHHEICVIPGMDGFQFSNVSSGVHSIVVRGSSVSEPQRVNSVQLEVSDFSFTAEPLGSTITVHITSSVDAAFRCRLDNNEFIPCRSK